MLVRGFGLSPSELATQNQQLIIATVKKEFQRQALETHPDLAAAEQKLDAAEKFVQLREDYEEAKKLLESGVRLSESIAWEPHGHVRVRQEGSAYEPHTTRQMRYADESAYRAYTPPPPEPTFDIVTRIKGITIVVTFLTVFGYALRELLAASCSGTMKWYPGTGVRRMSHFHTDARGKEEDAVAKVSRQEAQERERSRYFERRKTSAKRLSSPAPDND